MDLEVTGLLARAAGLRPRRGEGDHLARALDLRAAGDQPVRAVGRRREGGIELLLVAAEEDGVVAEAGIQAGAIDVFAVRVTLRVIEETARVVHIDAAEIIRERRSEPPRVAVANGTAQLVALIVLRLDLRGVAGQHLVVVVVRVELPGDEQLPPGVEFIDLFGLLFGPHQRGQKQAGQNRDDGDDHQQFEEREPRPAVIWSQ